MMLFNRELILLALFASIVLSQAIQNVRDVPVRVVYSSPTDPDSMESLEPISDFIDDLPELEAKVTLPMAWIKEFMAFKSHDVYISLVGETRPLKSKFTNFERTMSDDEDLRSWTRYIIDHDRDDINAENTTDEEESVDLKIDEFISYLVEQKGFKSDDLQFLHRPDLDYGYEQIETELSRIYDLEKSAQNIKVWGEILQATRSFSIRISFLLTFVAVVISACLLAF